MRYSGRVPLIVLVAVFYDNMSCQPVSGGTMSTHLPKPRAFSYWLTCKVIFSLNNLSLKEENSLSKCFSSIMYGPMLILIWTNTHKQIHFNKKKNPEILKPPPKVRDLNRSVLFLYCSFTISSDLPKQKEIWIPWRWRLYSMWSTAASRVALNLLLRQLCSKQSYICVKPWCGDQKIRPSYENHLLKTEIQNTDLLTSRTCLL